jgi:hypothetical protein
MGCGLHTSCGQSIISMKGSTCGCVLASVVGEQALLGCAGIPDSVRQAFQDEPLIEDFNISAKSRQAGDGSVQNSFLTWKEGKYRPIPEECRACLQQAMSRTAQQSQTSHEGALPLPRTPKNRGFHVFKPSQQLHSVKTLHPFRLSLPSHPNLWRYDIYNVQIRPHLDHEK